jgi:hypothetical protein
MMAGMINQPDFIIKKKVKSSSTGTAFYNRKKGYANPQ